MTTPCKKGETLKNKEESTRLRRGSEGKQKNMSKEILGNEVQLTAGAPMEARS